MTLRNIVTKGQLVLSRFSSIQLFVTPWTVARQAPLSMEFSRQEYESGLPCPSPGDLPNPGIKPASPALQADSLPLSHQGSPKGQLGHDETKHHPDLSDLKAYFSYHYIINSQSPIILPSSKRHLGEHQKGVES